MKKHIASLCMLGAVLGSLSVSAADLKAGKEKAGAVCQACHGLDGNSALADNPKIGGQHRDYLAKALRDYKSKMRKNPIMAAFASTLSPKDIDDLAAYYSSQPRVVATQD